MSSQLDKLHESAADKARRWSLGEEFLDTETLRGIGYGNLVLRRQSHLYLGHGVIAAVLLLLCFWLISANWDALTGWTGLFGKEERVVEYTAVTSVTQLPPPPPIAQPAAPPPAQKVAPPKAEVPPNVGKIKKVKKEEAPPEQTLATQKEIKEVIQPPQGVDGGIGDAPVFVPVEIMPSFIQQRKPRYPERARRAGLEGKVFVGVLISENGRAIKAQIMRREPADRKEFDKAAIEAVMKSRYSPGIQNGKPVKVWLMLPIRFMLR